MKVLHVGTTDIAGGAARAAYRLHRGLRDISVPSSMFVREKESDDDAVREFTPSTDFVSWARRRWRHEWVYRSITPYDRPDGYEKFSDDRTRYGARVVEQLPTADLYNLHLVANFVDLEAFFERTTAPVVWTLHDMVAFTGGCHYTAGCTRFVDRCGRCPQLGSSEDDDLSRAIWERKKTVYGEAIDEGRLHVATPSNWLAEEARRSALLGEAPVDVIPYSLDTDTFRPREGDELQAALEIPSSHRVLLFVAGNTAKRRKGMSLLVRAFEERPPDDVTLVSIGGNSPPVPERVPHVHLGSINSDLLLSVFYSMADVFVIPSRQDNLPNTVLEAMACGTPVVGFEAGGIPDMVRPGETGWLAEAEDATALREAIGRSLASEDTRTERAKRCREIVVEEYDLPVQAQQYRELYDRVLGD